MLSRAGWHFDTISWQESKGQVAQQKQKKVPPFHPSALRNRPFSFSNLMANFHYIPLLSQTVVIPKTAGDVEKERKKEAIPSLGSLQWNPPIPPAFLHRPHKLIQDFKGELTMHLFPTTTSSLWSPFHPAPKGNQKQIHGKWGVEYKNHQVVRLRPTPTQVQGKLFSPQRVTKIVGSAKQQVNTDWPSHLLGSPVHFLVPSLFSTLWALENQTPCWKEWLHFPEQRLISPGVSLHQHNTTGNVVTGNLRRGNGKWCQCWREETPEEQLFDLGEKLTKEFLKSCSETP